MREQVISDQLASAQSPETEAERRMVSALLLAKSFQQALSVVGVGWAALVQKVREQTVYVRDERTGVWRVTNPVFPGVEGEGPTATMGWNDLLAKAGKEES